VRVARLERGEDRRLRKTHGVVGKLLALTETIEND
jgi:hypothetical protein